MGSDCIKDTVMVEMLPGYVDMSLEPKDNKDDAMCAAEQPRYPWGLGLSLGDEQLQKLGLSTDCEVGDMLQLDCLVKVTSVSRNETTTGVNSNLSLQIVGIAAEDDEPEEEVPAPRRKMGPSTFYK